MRFMVSVLLDNVETEWLKQRALKRGTSIEVEAGKILISAVKCKADMRQQDHVDDIRSRFASLSCISSVVKGCLNIHWVPNVFFAATNAAISIGEKSTRRKRRLPLCALKFQSIKNVKI